MVGKKTEKPRFFLPVALLPSAASCLCAVSHRPARPRTKTGSTTPPAKTDLLAGQQEKLRKMMGKDHEFKSRRPAPPPQNAFGTSKEAGYPFARPGVTDHRSASTCALTYSSDAACFALTGLCPEQLQE